MKYRCDNCGSTAKPAIPWAHFPELGDILMRLEPGGEVPAGECKCGALTYLVKDPEVKEAVQAVTHLLAVTLIERFTITRCNSGNLLDTACPNCGYRGPFDIGCTVNAIVTDIGHADTEGDVEWNDESSCFCRKCSHSGILHEFTFPGLDALLAKQATNRATAAAKAVRKKLWHKDIKVEDTL